MRSTYIAVAMNPMRAPLWFQLGLLLALAWVLFSVVFWDIQSRRLDASLIPVAPEVAVPNAGRRLWLDNDSAYWLIHVRDMIEKGRWRIRHTMSDNAPYGRPVHWSQSLSWLILAGGTIRRFFTGQPLFAAAEDAAVWINPVLHLAFMSAATLAIHRRRGPVAALILAGILLTQPDLDSCFQPLRPDHQSLLVVFIIGSLFCLWARGPGRMTSALRTGVPARWKPSVFESNAASELHPPIEGSACRRQLWILSGILSGLALWIGATVSLIVWTPILCVVIFHRLAWGGRADLSEPVGWRAWGWSTGLTAILFYLVEYAPFRVIPRWEVNHPLYALSFILWGEALCRAATPDGVVRRRRFVAMALALGALLPPALPLLLPAGYHAMRDPLMLRFHRDIYEFGGIAGFLRRKPAEMVVLHFGLLPFVVLAAVARGFRRAASEADRHLAIAGWLAVFFGLLSLFQIRWLPYFAGSAAIVASGFAARAGHTAVTAGPRCKFVASIGHRAVVIALLLHPLLFAIPAAWRMRQIVAGDIVRPTLVRAALFKRLALKLREAIDTTTPIFMTEPDAAAALYYHARIPTIASYYWENDDGLRAWCAFFGDETGEDAARIAARRGITHAMVSRGTAHAMTVQWVARGVEDRASAARMVAARLVGSGPPIPDWLAPNPGLTAIGMGKYRLESARRAPQIWDTRFAVFDVRFAD